MDHCRQAAIVKEADSTHYDFSRLSQMSDCKTWPHVHAPMSMLRDFFGKCRSPVIGERFGGLAEEWPDCRAIREKIEN